MDLVVTRSLKVDQIILDTLNHAREARKKAFKGVDISGEEDYAVACCEEGWWSASTGLNKQSALRMRNSHRKLGRLALAVDEGDNEV